MRTITSIFKTQKRITHFKRRRFPVICRKNVNVLRKRFYSEKTTEKPKENEPVINVAPGYEDFENLVKDKLKKPTFEVIQDLDTRYFSTRKLLEEADPETLPKFDEKFKSLNAKQKAAIEEILKARDEVVKESYNTNKNIDWRPIFDRLNLVSESDGQKLNEPVRVAITGASGQIGYSLIFRIASGAMFGPKTPVILHLLELPQALKALQGVVMELEDCAFPLVRGIVATDNAEKAFEGVDYALLVGAKPRGPGMERKDLLKENALIFKDQGRALNKVGKGKNTRIAVVGNPANTNAYITSHYAPEIPPQNITAMTRLDYNRGISMLANQLKCDLRDIKRFVIWGNHSSTQFPDISHATLGDKFLPDLIDRKWFTGTFIPNVQKRGQEVIKAKDGKSSAASAASALVDHIRDWHLGSMGKWTSIGVYSEGEYGVTKGLYYSYPVIHNPKSYDIVKDLPIDEFAAEKMEATHKELLEERNIVSSFL